MKIKRLTRVISGLFVLGMTMQSVMAAECETCSGGLTNVVLHYDVGQPGDTIEVMTADSQIIFSGSPDSNGLIVLGPGAVLPINNDDDSGSDDDDSGSDDDDSGSDDDDSGNDDDDSGNDDNDSGNDDDDSGNDDNDSGNDDNDSGNDDNDSGNGDSGSSTGTSTNTSIDGPALSVLSETITLLVNGNVNASFSTGCSSPIGPGLVMGSFTVVNGASVDGGALCEVAYVAMPVSTGSQPDTACCDGNVSNLTMTYRGQGGVVTVTQESAGQVFSQTLFTGDTFELVGVDASNTLGSVIVFSVDGSENATLHTSCSVPVGPGLVVGDFVVVSGQSLNGGALCAMGSETAAECVATTDPVVDICTTNPFDPSCFAVDICTTNPFDPSCFAVDICTTNPFDPSCFAVVDCTTNPFDPACSG